MEAKCIVFRLRVAARSLFMWRSTPDLLEEAANEIETLRKQISGHCDRIAAQSEILSRRAEKEAGGK